VDRRRRILNLPELTSNLILGRVAEKRGASIHQKVRVADVLDLDRGVLSPELVSYGLRAHFDFVVGEQDGGKAFFAVEYDGPSHAWPSTQERDSKKNDICHLLHFPLLRVDSAYLRDDLGGGKSLLEWLTNLWFEYQSFLRGEHPGINHHDGRSIVRVDLRDAHEVETGGKGGAHEARPR
jgi:hypothetical protein